MANPSLLPFLQGTRGNLGERESRGERNMNDEVVGHAAAV